MNRLRTRSLQELVQKMMEINTGLGSENNPSMPDQNQPETVSSGKSGGIPTDTREQAPVKSEVLPEDISEQSQTLLEFNRMNVIRGIVFGEILGKPKGRRGRW